MPLFRRHRLADHLEPGETVHVQGAAPPGAELSIGWTCSGCNRRWRKFIGHAGHADLEGLTVEIACPDCDPSEAAAVGVVPL